MLAKDIAIMAEGIQRLGRKIPDTPGQLMVLARLLLIISRRLEERLAQQLASHRLNHSELVTLMFLYIQPDRVATPTELCAVTWEGNSNMTRIANTLIERGLIERAPSPTDRRRVMIGITPAGSCFVRKLVPTMFPVLHKLFDGFNAANLAQLNRLLIRLASNVDRLQTDEPKAGPR